MAELASLTALGGVLGDTFQNQEIIRVFSDGVYVWSQATVTADDTEDTRPRWLTEPTDTGAAALAGLTWLDPAAGYPAASANDVIQVHADVTIGGDTWPAGSIVRAETDTPGGVDADWSLFVSGASTSLYSDDGTLTGNRSVDSGGNTLDVQGDGRKRVIDDDGTNTSTFDADAGAGTQASATNGTETSSLLLQPSGLTAWRSTNGAYYLGDVSGNGLPTLNSDGPADEVLAINPVNGSIQRAAAEAYRVVPVAGAPVDGTTVAYYVGQLFFDTTGKALYEATAQSTNPDLAATGSTFAQVPFDVYYDRDSFGVRTSDPDPAEVGKHYTLTYGAGGSGFTLPPLANADIGDIITFTNTNGETVTVAPNGGEDLNGVTNGSFVSDQADKHVRIEKVSATEWRAVDITTDSASDVFAQLSQWDVDNTTGQGTQPVVASNVDGFVAARIEGTDAAGPQSARYALLAQLPTAADQYVRIKIRRDATATAAMALNVGDGTNGFYQVVISPVDGANDVQNFDIAGSVYITPPSIVDLNVGEHTIEAVILYPQATSAAFWYLIPDYTNLGDLTTIDPTVTGAVDVLELDMDFDYVPASAAVATLLDSSAAPVVETLPAATGSGAILFYANEDVASNSATLAPASGEQLNSVVDGTFLFSNYAAGTQFRADDIGPGQWVVSVVGAGTQTALAYAYLWESETTEEDNIQSIVTAAVPNATVLMPITQKLDLSTPAGLDVSGLTVGADAITATTGGRYSISGAIGVINNFIGGRSIVQLVRNDTEILAVSFNEGDGTDDRNHPVPVEWSGSLAAGDSVSFLIGTNSATNIFPSFYTLAVQQLPNTESVLAGMVTPTAIPRARLELVDEEINGVFGVNRNALDLALNANTMNALPFTRAAYAEGGMVATLGGWADNNQASQVIDGTNNTMSVVVPEDGWYRIAASSPEGANVNADDRPFIGVAVNGVGVQGWDDGLMDTSGSTHVPQQFETKLQLAAGDMVQVGVYIEGGDGETYNLNSGTASMSNALSEGETLVAYFDIEKLHESTIVMPDALVPETLDYLSMSMDSSGGSASGNGAISGDPIALSDADWVVKYDNAGILDTANDRVLIAQDGLYRVQFSMVNAAAVSLTLELKVDGAVVAVGGVGASDSRHLIDWTGDLTAGQAITIASTTNVYDPTLTVQQLPSYSVVAYQPDTVEAKPLAVDFVELASDTNFTAAYADVLTLALPEAGRYRVHAKVAAAYDISAAPNRARLYNVTTGTAILGSEITLGSTDVAAGNWRGTHSTERVIAVTGPTTVSLQAIGATTGASIILSDTDGNTSLGYEQLPTLEVVQPGSLVPSALGSMRAYVSTSFAQGAGATNIINPSQWAILDDTLGFADNGTTEITLTEGRYKASMWLAETSSTDRWTGSWQVDGSDVGLLGSSGDADDPNLSKAPAIAEITVGAGQTRTLGFRTVDSPTSVRAFSANDPGAWWEIEQLPTLEVVQPGSISVDDQTASGYLDLGDMRIQQGRGVTSGGNQTITYPAPFADTSYSLTVTPASAGSDFTSYSADTATGATIHTWNDAGNPVDLSYSWIAIGAKP